MYINKYKERDTISNIITITEREGWHTYYGKEVVVVAVVVGTTSIQLISA